jgi:hypothetical protein
MRLVGEGFNTLVFVSPDGWVLKVAKYRDALPRLIHERDSVQCVQEISINVPNDYRIVELQRDKPDEKSATIRMRIWCRGLAIITSLGGGVNHLSCWGRGWGHFHARVLVSKKLDYFRSQAAFCVAV